MLHHWNSNIVALCPWLKKAQVVKQMTRTLNKTPGFKWVSHQELAKLESFEEGFVQISIKSNVKEISLNVKSK